MVILLRVTWLRNKVDQWVEEREKKLDETYNKDNPLELEKGDLLAMIIAAFQVLLPVLFLFVAVITLLFLGFSFLMN